jgi:hypothetical protein
MDIGKSFTYIFDDTDWWKKLGIGALVSLVPVFNFAWIGYTVEVMKNVKASSSKPLPDWQDMGSFFTGGLFLSLAMLLYSLPGLLLFLLPVLFMVVPALFNNQSDLLNALLTALTGVSCVLGCLLLLYFLAISFLYPAVMIHYAEKKTFGACFEVKAILAQVSARFGDYLTAWVVWIGGSFAVGLVVSLVNGIFTFIPCLGWIATIAIGLFSGVYTTAIEAHLFGQFARGSQTITTLLE